MLYLNSGPTEILIKCTEQIGALQEKKSKAFKYQEVKSKIFYFFLLKDL